MDRIFDLILSAGLWGSIALLIWCGLVCVRDTSAAERRNAAKVKLQVGPEAEQDRPHARLALGE